MERFEFAHDGDLYSWIVKDILVDQHIRLIGQLTSAPGIFIGGLFYYLLIPFFLLFNRDPIGVIFFSVITGLSTMLSYYFVFIKLFKKEAGFIWILVVVLFFGLTTSPISEYYFSNINIIFLTIVRSNYNKKWSLLSKSRLLQ